MIVIKNSNDEEQPRACTQSPKVCIKVIAKKSKNSTMPFSDYIYAWNIVIDSD